MNKKEGTPTFLGAIHTERVFTFQCATFPLFFYVNMRLMDVHDRYARISRLLQHLAHERHVFKMPCQVKRISTFTLSAAHQSQFQSSGPIRRTRRRGKHCKLLFTVASRHDNCFIVVIASRPEVGSNELHLLRCIYLSKFFG